MNILDDIGQTVLLQHEGDQQLASVLTTGVRALLWRLGRLLGVLLRNAPGERQPP